MEHATALYSCHKSSFLGFSINLPILNYGGKAQLATCFQLQSDQFLYTSINHYTLNKGTLTVKDLLSLPRRSGYCCTWRSEGHVPGLPKLRSVAMERVG